MHLREPQVSKVVLRLNQVYRSIEKDKDKWLKEVRIECSVNSLQNLCTLRTWMVIGRVLSTWKTIENLWIFNFKSSNPLSRYILPIWFKSLYIIVFRMLRHNSLKFVGKSKLTKLTQGLDWYLSYEPWKDKKKSWSRWDLNSKEKNNKKMLRSNMVITFGW